MNRQLKDVLELFDYLMYAYTYSLEDVQTKKGVQKRLKDTNLEQVLREQVKENIKVKDLNVELKLGPSYNRTENPWIQIYTTENKSGAKGRYVGISFSKDIDEIQLWIGFGKTSKKRDEIFELSKGYKIKYSLIEPNLQYNFEYKEGSYNAVFIEKRINIKTFEKEEFERDLEYITDLYKAYEKRFENSTINLSENEKFQYHGENEISYEELNNRMLDLMEEVGNLARMMKELKNGK